MSISDNGIAAWTIMIKSRICAKSNLILLQPVITISPRMGILIMVEQTIHIAIKSANLIPVNG